jgi:hypothetical protein
MSKLSISIFALCIFFSCSPDQEIKSDNPCHDSEYCSKEINLSAATFPQQWVLIKMSAMMANSETTGEDMPWQESIILNTDSTFTKHRKLDGITSEASGTFTFEIGKSNPPFIQLSLHYNAANDLVGNCYGDPSFEAYWMDAACSLKGTWSHCDGPGMEYKRVFENCDDQPDDTD